GQSLRLEAIQIQLVKK
ncbi:MAG: hypothetical protein ACTID1_02690, partial [Pseudolactococcus laudensis]